MIQALQITGTPAFVRVAWNTPDLMMRALDCGAEGVIVPMVSNAQQARDAVRACRYAPDGYRSWGPTRASLGHDDYSPHTANEGVVCVVMIETQEAMDNLDSILEVKGVDGIYIGPSDLAVAYGIAPTGDPTDARHIALIDTILRSCQKHRVTAGINCDSVESAIRWRDLGFRMLNVASDAKFVRNGATNVVRALRETST
jgi:4-hydroxy-2-oxoheptanedioate aldolase